MSKEPVQDGAIPFAPLSERLDVQVRDLQAAAMAGHEAADELATVVRGWRDEVIQFEAESAELEELRRNNEYLTSQADLALQSGEENAKLRAGVAEAEAQIHSARERLHEACIALHRAGACG